jgi:hypothetical protein
VSRRRLGHVLPQAGRRCPTRRTCNAPMAAGQAQAVAPLQRKREWTVPPLIPSTWGIALIGANLLVEKVYHIFPLPAETR